MNRYVVLISTLILSCSSAMLCQAQDTLYVFLNADCPVCRTIAKDIQVTADSFPNVTVLGVISNDMSSEVEMEEFRHDFSLRFSFIYDLHGALAERLQAHTTPECVVIHDTLVVYKGRFNNAYVSIGRRRQVVTEHDVHDVLTSLYHGKVPEYRETEATGCAIEPRWDDAHKK